MRTETDREITRLRSEQWRAKLKQDSEAYSAYLARSNATRRQRMADPEYRARAREVRRIYNQTKKAKQLNCDSQRRVRLRRKGLTQEAYDQMVEAQGGLCAICRTSSPTRSGKPSGWPIDHCHKTGKIRGLLCHDCNVTLGRFGDDPEQMRRWAESAANYLANTAAVNLEFRLIPV